MKRAIILKYVFVKSLATPPTDYLADVMSQWSPEERSQFTAESTQISARLVDQLKAAGLWENVEERERSVLLTGMDQVSPQQQVDCSWLAESIVCLFWALKVIPEVPSYDQEASHESVKMLPAISILDLVKRARLRTQKEIERQRDIAELWHWRARTRKLQEEGQLRGELPGGFMIEQVIEMTAMKANEKGVLSKPIGSDFPAQGKPYRDLSSDEFTMLTSIAQERHKAFNWLCGMSPSGMWKDTPTHT